MDISVTISDAQYAELKRLLYETPQNVDRAAASAINKTVATGATRIRRELSRLAKMPVRRFGKRVKPQKTDASELVGKIKIYNFNIPAIQTGITPVRGGTYPLEKKATGTVLQNSPFKQKMQSGHEGWFVRFGPKRKMTTGRYAGRVREPIKQVFTHSPRKLWESTPGIAATQMSMLGDVLQKNLDSQIDRFLK